MGLRNYEGGNKMRKYKISDNFKKEMEENIKAALYLLTYIGILILGVIAGVITLNVLIILIREIN